MNLKYFSDPRDAENFEPFPIMFSRNSVAYEGNGASLASNQPSFIEGSKGVYGLGVYEQYSNILTSSLSQDFNGAWTSGTLNGTYTIKIGSGGGSITLSGGATGTVTSGNSLTFTVTSNTVTFTPTGSCLNTIILNKPYPLPWIIGGTTRQPEQCYIPVEEVKKFLSLNEGCIECIINANTPSKHTSVSKYIFSHQTGGVQENWIALFHTTTNQWELATKGLTTYNPVRIPDTHTGKTLFTANYNSSELSLSVGGVESKVSNHQLPSLIGANFFIGDYGTSNRNINTNINSLVFSKPRTTEERLNRQKFAMANGYYPIDDKVQAFLDLESGLRGYRRTTQ